MNRLLTVFAIAASLAAQAPKPGLFVNSGGGTGGGGTITGCGFGQTLNGTVCDTNTAIIPSRTIDVSGVDATCIPASASATVLTCSMVGNALPAYTNGMRVMLRPDVTLSGAPTLNINALGAKNLYANDGTTAASGTAGQSYQLVYNSTLNASAGGWVFPATGGSSAAALSGIFLPFGPEYPASSSLTIGTVNTVNYFQFNVPSPGVQISTYVAHTAAGTGTVGLGIMDSSCNLVAGSTATAAAPGAAITVFTPASAVTLNAGVYFFGWTSTVATDSLYIVSASWMSTAVNSGLGATVLKLFKGATVSASGVLPASCGARTALVNTTYPFVAARN